MVIGLLLVYLGQSGKFLSAARIGCESVSVIRHPEPIIVLSPIVIVVVALMVEPDMPTLLPIMILLPDAEILKKQGWKIPTELDVNLLLHIKPSPIIISPFIISGCFSLNNQDVLPKNNLPLIDQELLYLSPERKHHQIVGIVRENNLYNLTILLLKELSHNYKTSNIV